ncbi:IS256 family transposase [Emticicia oligotrophica]|uniref:IS256 family transposase n=1 Tax=Emticicia oligotrophica TaxID=312279 RepID=UPI00273CEB06|nr:IS256 family transposase [Emticicia oligotrophica]
MNKQEPFDFASFQEEAIKGLYSGKPLTGEKGIFAPMLKHFLEQSLQGEMDAHLASERSIGNTNRRNGLSSKRIKSSAGEFELETPRDRLVNFEPNIVAKRQVVLTDQLEGQIISMYGRGMSYSDIGKHIQEIYGYSLSPSEISSITDKVLPMLREWQIRPLSNIYIAAWLDAMYYKVRVDGKVVTRVLYSVIGLNLQGKKEILGIYLTESEGAKFWLSVLQDFKQRGVNDIFIACVDGLKGFPEAIESVFPTTQIQLCIVHQIRGSLRFIPEKHVKEFIVDLKSVYQANTREIGEENLLLLGEKWGKLYPKAVESWVNNWEHLSVFFQYSQAIRRIIYTTNTIEAYHRQIRKITKTKGAFTSDNALLKLAYLAIMNMDKLWNKTVFSWREILSEISIIFANRISNEDFEL